MRIALAALLLALLLGGCAAQQLTPQQCAVADWRAIGFEDGAQGRASTRLADHVGVCAGTAQPDRAAYEAGRAEGLRQYCLPENGWRMGREGRDYKGVCPNETAQAFLREYSRGRAERLAYERAWDYDYDDHGFPSILWPGYRHHFSAPYLHRHHRHRHGRYW